MKNSSTTVRLTPKGAEVLANLKRKYPDAPLAKIVEKALQDKQEYPAGIYISHQEESEALLVLWFLWGEAEKLTAASRELKPEAAAQALALKAACKVFRRIFVEARGRIKVERKA